jgi:hypothetical protein
MHNWGRASQTKESLENLATKDLMDLSSFGWLCCLCAWSGTESASERAANALIRADILTLFFCFFEPPLVGWDLGPV